jgi:hypothetical protein
MKIERGKFYKRRDGEISGPMQANGNPDFPYLFDGSSYTEEGRYLLGKENQWDLIEEVSDPSLPKPVPVEIPPAAEPVETAPATPDAPDLGEVEIHPSRLLDSMEAYRASENHVFRNKYREMTDFEKRTMEELKSRAYWLLCHIEAHIPEGRYQSLAKTALEESVMWAVKEITK